jgi:hypothetical protein
MRPTDLICVHAAIGDASNGHGPMEGLGAAYSPSWHIPIAIRPMAMRTSRRCGSSKGVSRCVKKPWRSAKVRCHWHHEGMDCHQSQKNRGRYSCRQPELRCACQRTIKIGIPMQNRTPIRIQRIFSPPLPGLCHGIAVAAGRDYVYSNNQFRARLPTCPTTRPRFPQAILNAS